MSEIIITSNVKGSIKDFLRKISCSRIAVLCDENTARHCLPLIKEACGDFTLIRIKSGEENKNLGTCEHIWNEMTNARLDRKALLINLGGGVIGDMGGFCAATYKRGIDFIQIPTTLLSQVDASVGGKLGIDFHSFKNHIGVFKDPAAVIIDTVFLKTLNKAELVSGYAEVIKHCLIADAAMWQKIKNHKPEELDMNELVAHSVAIKSKITEEDPYEKGLRKILNFGHTIGHAVESFFLEIPGKKMLHGEAIAIGMICESYISMKRGFISEKENEEIKSYILSVYGKKEISDQDIEKIIPLTLQDKKNEQNEIQCTLLEQPGKANFNNPVGMEEMREALGKY